jgi:membrane protein
MAGPRTDLYRPRTEVDRIVAARTAAEVKVEKPASDKKKAAPATLLKRLMARPGIAHLIRAFDRYSERLGAQFAGAITYFSFLALVPLLMVAFAAVGILLYNRPDLVTEIADRVAAALPGSLGDEIAKVIDTAVSSRYTVGIVGLAIALYSGIGWMGNLREAVRAQWRPKWEEPAERKDNFVVALLKNLVNLAGLGVAIVLSLALTAAAGTAQSWVLSQLGLDDVTWLKPIFSILTFLIAIGADVVIFYWLYSRLPEPHYRPPSKALWRGALAAAVAFEILKFVLTFFLPRLSSPTAVVFGSIIGLLLFINLVSQMLLFVAAWIATAPGMDFDDDKNKLPEVPGPPMNMDRGMGTGEAIGLVSVGAAAGWLGGRRASRKG